MIEVMEILAYNLNANIGKIKPINKIFKVPLTMCIKIAIII
ncbi:hypothetical protein ACFLKB_08030 [Clostridium sp. FAM 1755]